MSKATTSASFSAADFKTVSAEVLKAVAPLEEKFGVKFKLARGTYGVALGIKLEAARVGETGDAETTERAAFRLNASLFGLNPEDLNRTFAQGGKKFKIVGLNPRARRNPIIAQDASSGKEYVFPADIVRFYLSQAT